MGEEEERILIVFSVCEVVFVFLFIRQMNWTVILSALSSFINFT